jgi:ATP-dependent helicase/DNAse subunit B
VDVRRCYSAKFLLQAVILAVSPMDSLLAIYPTARKVEDLLKRQSRQGCPMGHRVVTFPQLVDALWREYGTDRVLLSAIGERIAIEEAMGRANNIRDIAGQSGLTDHLHALVRQVKSATLTAEDLRAASKALSRSGAARVEMVAAILAGYEALLDERALADAHDRERAVLDGLLQAERLGTRPRFLAGVTRLLVAEIYDFGLLQFMIVAALIRLVGDARLTIQAEPHAVNANRFPELTWNRFVSEESIADKVLPQFVRRGGRQGRLGFILTNIFSGNYPAPPLPDGTVSIIEAPSRRREVEEVARAIRRVLERPPSERIPLDRIAVVTRDLNPYADHLEAIFRRYRIPLRLGATQPLRAAPPTRFITDVLKIPRDGYRREAILGLLNTPYVRVAARAHRSMLTETGYIDRATMPFEERIAKRRREIAEALDQETDQGKRAALQGKLSRTDAAAKAFAELFAILETLEPPARVADHVERLSAALDGLGFDPAAHSLADAAATAMGPLVGALEELAREARMIAPERVVSLDEFAALTEAALAEATIENRKRPEQGVEALSVIDARGLDFDLVFVIGLNDGAFPLYHRDDPLIPDDLKLALNRPLATALRRRFGANAPNALGRILRTRYDRNAEDWFLFFLALSMPEREVVLSYSAADENGNPLLRSPFVEEVLKLLGEHAYEDGVRGTGTVVRRVGAGIPAPDDCFAADEFLNFAAQNRLLDHAAVSSIAVPERLASIARRSEVERRRESYLTLPTREDRAESASSMEKLALANLYDGRVAADARLHRLLLQKADGTPRPWSASQLSEFASCGFKYFAGRILSLREEDEPDYEQSPLESGDAVHEILREIVARGVDFSDRRAARAAAGKVLTEQYAWRHREARDPAFFDVQWRSVRQMVEEAIEYETRRRDRGGESPSQFEPEFALSFAIDEGGTASEPLRVALEGRIDRLELYRAGHSGPIRKIKVVDYKTSRNLSGFADKLKNELGLTDFQIPVYALGALTSFASELAPGATIEASYLVLKSREKETASVRLEPDLIELDPHRRAILAEQGIEPYTDRVVRLVRAAVNGEFDVDPLKCDPWCPHRRLCRYYKPAS